MNIKAILFDLDGTLLPMDLPLFVNIYFASLTQKMTQHGYEPKVFADAIEQGIQAMVKNTGEQTNESVFWSKFTEIFGEKAKNDMPLLQEYYENDFDKVRIALGCNPKSAETVYALKDMGYRVILATNPVFPAIATQKRVRIAGLSHEDFEICTTYENSRFCKPNPSYYLDIAKTLDLAPEECLMVGNDVTEDMVAETVGMKVFLLTEFLINRQGKDISVYPNGDMDDLMNYIRTL